ncbi:MAG TPA: cation diffusion facilitator family transporter [Jatrophihabitans sp.]|jgi:cation diffusion facilitator family transporter|uniref:cation diffusion facilitator family transporter n=1 Tax=Jatrophihabitans sp. TaxID=1932789 RepID=UPI002EE1BB24
MSAASGTKAVVAALLANAGIAVMKFIAFLITGSSSMLAESVHSVADSGNQGLLLVGGRRSRRQATAEHPFGFGRDRYVYGFLVALVLFTIGGMFALYEGIHKITDPHELDSPLIAIAVLVGAIGLETWSFRTAIHESRKVKGDASWPQFIRRAKVPELPVVLLEDLAALVGLFLALGGVGLTMLTDEPIWDGIGTVSIGVLLITVAVILIIETKSLLLGESASPAAISRIEAALVGEGIERVIHSRTLHLGPEEVLVAAKVSMAAGSSMAECAAAINAAEARIRAAEPTARVIYLEPDLYQPELVEGTASPAR